MPQYATALQRNECYCRAGYFETHARWPIALAVAGCLYAVWSVGDVARAEDATVNADVGLSKETLKETSRRSHKKKVSLSSKDNKTQRREVPVQPETQQSTVAKLRKMDQLYGYKGWAIPFPSFSDTVLQDAGGFRSTLAEYGFGIIGWTGTVAQINLLDTPSHVPESYPTCTSKNHLRGICAGNQAYFGQGADGAVMQTMFLTYDLGRLGLNGGQLQVQGFLTQSTDQGYYPNTDVKLGISYYQSLFNGTLEAKIGWANLTSEVIGSSIGGNYANPFGPSTSIPIELGLSIAPSLAPFFRLKWNIYDHFYNQTLVQRSLPVNGTTGNPIYDEVNSGNFLGMNFESEVDGTGVLLLDEFGYQRRATPGVSSTWVRAGAMLNTSDFRDFSKLATGGTKNDVPGFYFLADQQLWQQDPSSPRTAHRGIYAGVTYMYTPPETAAFYEYVEGRLYWIGPFANRPRDMLQLVYTHNEISPDLADYTNKYSKYTGIFTNYSTNTFVASYIAHLQPGVYASAGVTYTDNPSISYFPDEGSALNVVASVFINY